MPYIDLHSKDEFLSLWYITNTLLGNVGGFDPEKPTIIMLHPSFLDSTWLHGQFADPRLDAGFNLIAFDMRVSGKSMSRPSGRHDAWVEAADLALAHQALHLPPSHVIAFEAIATNCALRFAALFSEMCLSLTLCNVASPVEFKWMYSACDEIMQSWGYAEDLDSFEHTAMEAINCLLGADGDADLHDEIIGYWEMQMPPFRRQRMLEQMHVLINRTPMKPAALAAITAPVLLVQAEKNERCPLKYAQKLTSELVNAKGGAHLFPVKGATGYLSIVPSHASITTQVFTKFVTRLPHARSDLVPPALPMHERMQQALDRLASLADMPSIAARDPISALSFSCLDPAMIKVQTDALVFYGKDQMHAFSPLTPLGRPIRSYSERKKGHWFHAEDDGLSHAGRGNVPLPEPQAVSRSKTKKKVPSLTAF